MIKIKDMCWDKYKIEEWETCYVSYVPQRSQEWFDLRVGRITMSTIGSCVGHSIFVKEEDYEDLGLQICGLKKKEFDDKQKEAMEAGVKYEPIARDEFCKAIKPDDGKIDEPGICIWKKDERFAASPDGIFMKDGKKCGLEIKCPRAIHKCFKEDRKIYDNYLDQVIGCGVICGLKRMYFFEYGIEDNQSIGMKVKINKKRWNDIYKKASTFHDKYVLPRL